MRNVISEGDWKVETIQPQQSPDNNFRILKPLTAVTALGHTVAICGDGLRTDDEYKKGIILSNARLIAAAPDLIEACYEFIFSTDIEKLTFQFNHEQQAAIRMMRAAIKKAML